MNKMYERILQLEEGLYSNEHTRRIEYYYNQLSKRYSNFCIAGGCIVDAVYELPSYDIDIFVYYKDVDNWQDYAFDKVSWNGMIGLIRDEIDGLPMDIIMTDIPLDEYVRSFDLNLKSAYYMNGKFIFTEESKRDFETNTLTIKNLSGEVNYFRYMRTVKKYNINVDSRIMYILCNYIQHHISNERRLRASKKYADDIESTINTWTNIDNYNEKLYKKTKYLMQHNRRKHGTRDMNLLFNYIERKSLM